MGVPTNGRPSTGGEPLADGLVLDSAHREEPRAPALLHDIRTSLDNLGDTAQGCPL